MPLRTEGGNVFYDCMLCEHPFLFAPHEYRWSTYSCLGCANLATTASGNIWMALCLNPIPN